MPVCKCPGEDLVGSMKGFSGEGRGQRQQTAVQNAYRDSGLLDAYITLMKNAFRWECDGECGIKTRFSITPGPSLVQDPNTGLWTAELVDVELKVWVVCSQR
jgi:hypothetical protein